MIRIETKQNKNKIVIKILEFKYYTNIKKNIYKKLLSLSSKRKKIKILDFFNIIFLRFRDFTSLYFEIFIIVLI